MCLARFRSEMVGQERQQHSLPGPWFSLEPAASMPRTIPASSGTTCRSLAFVPEQGISRRAILCEPVQPTPVWGHRADYGNLGLGGGLQALAVGRGLNRLERQYRGGDW